MILTEGVDNLFVNNKSFDNMLNGDAESNSSLAVLRLAVSNPNPPNRMDKNMIIIDAPIRAAPPKAYHAIICVEAVVF